MKRIFTSLVVTMMMASVLIVVPAGAALAAPAAPTLISPNGAVTDSTPTYTWNSVADATQYRLWVNDATGNPIDQTFTSTLALCAGGPPAICSITPGTAVSGNANWWIQASNPSGPGPWSASMAFQVNPVVPPPAANLISPSGVITDTTPTYTWNAVAGSSWYQLWVNDANGSPTIQQWYTAAAAGCAATCSVTPATAVSGVGSWWIQTWNTGGYGPWSAPLSFNTDPLPAATLISPTGAITDSTPTYMWNSVPGATYYQLWVNDPATPGTPKIAQWYTAAEAVCNGTCAVTPTTAVAGANQWWIQPWRSGEYGPWSAPLDFTVVGPPGFAKAFAPDTVPIGGTSTLTFTIDNGANLSGATDLRFRDNFPAGSGMVVAAAPNVVNNCAGVFTATAGADFVRLASGTVGASATCSISVDVTAPNAVGAFVNTTNALRSSAGNSGTASATLNTTAPVLQMIKTFLPDVIRQTPPGGGPPTSFSAMSFVINNPATIAATGLAFSDVFPAGTGMLVGPGASTNTCGGALVAPAFAASISYTGGTLAAGTQCLVIVPVFSTVLGAHLNTVSDLTSSSGASAPASATLNVTLAPLFTKTVNPDPIQQGGNSTVTFTIDNSGNIVPATGLAFSDSPMFGGSGATVPNPAAAVNTCGGTLTVTPAAVVTLTGGTVAAGATCSVTVELNFPVSGTWFNGTTALTSSLGTSPGGAVSIVVNPVAPVFTKAFGPNPVLVSPNAGGFDVSTLTWTVDNSANTEDANGLAWTDTFPAGMAIAPGGPAPVNVGFAAGTWTPAFPVAGDTSVGVTGAICPALAVCTLSVDVVSTAGGTNRLNTTGDLTGTMAGGFAFNAGTASARLRVVQLGFAAAFNPDPVPTGAITRLTFTIDNSLNNVAVSGLAFTVPPGLGGAGTVAPAPNIVTTCGGAVVPGGFAGGTVAANATCTIGVDITAGAVGPHAFITGPLTTAIGAVPGAIASLVVIP